MPSRPAVTPLVLALLAITALAGAKPAPAPPPATERYALALLWRGPQWTPERTPRTDSIQAGHMANIRAMWNEGSLVAAGPCGGDPALRGIFVWKVDSLADLGPMLANDPAVASGRLRPEVRRWFADPGVGADYRARIEANPAARDSMVSFTMVLLERGPAYTSNWTPRVKKVLEGHAKHVAKLRRDGALVLAGSFEGLGDPRGLLFFAGDSARTAAWLADDPAIRAGRFTTRSWRWWTAYGNVPGH